MIYIHFIVEPITRIELITKLYHSFVLPLNYIGIFLISVIQMNVQVEPRAGFRFLNPLRAFCKPAFERKVIKNVYLYKRIFS